MDSSMKFLSQCETEASVSPMINMLSGKKDKKSSSQKRLLSLTNNQLDEPNEEYVFEDKKKKKKKKDKEKHALDISLVNETQESVSEDKKKKKKDKEKNALDISLVNETQESVSEDKKKKKKKDKEKNALDISLVNETQESVSEVSGKKKKKNKEKRHSLSSQESELPPKEDTPVGKKKKKEKKRRRNSTGIDSNETLDDGAFEDSPKKKKKSDKQDSSFSLKSPKKSQATEGLDSSFTLKSPKKSKFEGGLDTSLSLKSHKKSKSEEGLDTSLSLMSSKKKKLDSQEIHVTPKSAKKVKESKREGLNISTSSKKKKKRKERSDETEEEEEEEAEKTGVIENGISEAASTMEEKSEPWSMEEELHLIDKVKETINANDKAFYKTRLNKIDWEEIAFVGRTAEECKETCNKLLKKINKTKSLTMILEEAKEMSLDSKIRQTRVLTPKNRFIRNYCKSHNSDDISRSELFLEASSAWMNLSKEERKAHVVEYENEVKELAKKLQKPPIPPKTPFLMFYEEAASIGGKSLPLKNKCQKLFKEMEYKEKILYIQKSISDCARYIKQYYAYKEAHPEWTNLILTFSSKSLIEEYFYYLGMPKYYQSPIALFYEDLKEKGIQLDCEPRDRLNVIGQKFRELPESKRQEYKKKCKKIQESFNENYQLWKENQSADMKLVLDTYFTFEKSDKRKNVKKFDNVLEVSFTKPKYLNEPLRPPVSALKIFNSKFEQRKKEKYSSAKELKDACSVAWKNLSSENKLKYKERHKENLEIYKESLLEYVRNLGVEAKTYLGFKRIDHYNFFKEDIFETEYPHKEFPVYVEQKSNYGVMPTLKKSDKMKSEKDTHEKSDSEAQSSSEEEEEEEEEDEIEVESDDGCNTKVVVMKGFQHPRTPVVPQKAPVEISSEEDEVDDVLEAWQTPKHHTGNSDKEEEDDDDDDDDDDSDKEKEQEDDSDDKEEEDDSDDKDEDSDSDDDDSLP